MYVCMHMYIYTYNTAAVRTYTNTRGFCPLVISQVQVTRVICKPRRDSERLIVVCMCVSHDMTRTCRARRLHGRNIYNGASA